MKNKTQEQIVIRELMERGCISRNWCLRNYISRLGAIICDLNKAGWELSGQYVPNEHGGKDYVYTLVKTPLERIEYKLPETGEVVSVRYLPKQAPQPQLI